MAELQDIVEGTPQELLEAKRYEERLMVRTVVEVRTRERVGATVWEIDWCLGIGQERIRRRLAELEADGEVRRWGRRHRGILWQRVGVPAHGANLGPKS